MGSPHQWQLSPSLSLIFWRARFLALRVSSFIGPWLLVRPSPLASCARGFQA